MRIRDILSGRHLLTPDYLVLDLESFLIDSNYGRGRIVNPQLLRTLGQLSQNYNIVCLMRPKNTGIVSKVVSAFTGDSKVESYGKLYTIPTEEWLGLITEYESILLYYEKLSSPELEDLITLNRRMEFYNNINILLAMLSKVKARGILHDSRGETWKQVHESRSNSMKVDRKAELLEVRKTRKNPLKFKIDKFSTGE